MPENQEAYVRYDKATGAVLGTYTVVMVEGPKPTAAAGTGVAATEPQPPSSPVRAALDHDTINEALGQPPPHVHLYSIRILRVPTALSQSANGYWVDDAAQTVTERVPLRLIAHRTVIDGNGTDTVVIDIVAVGQDGKPVDSFESDIRVTTAAGKLSEPGGRLRMKEGRASIQLTSSAETKARVTVIATEQTGRFAPGSITLEFL